MAFGLCHAQSSQAARISACEWVRSTSSAGPLSELHSCCRVLLHLVLGLGLGLGGRLSHMGRVPISVSHASVIHHPKAVRSTLRPEELMLCAHHRKPAGAGKGQYIPSCRHLQLQSKTTAVAARLRETGAPEASTFSPSTRNGKRYIKAGLGSMRSSLRLCSIAADRLLFPDGPSLPDEKRRCPPTAHASPTILSAVDK